MTKILVIENEEQARNMFLKCLQEEGFNAISAENGLVGVQRALCYLPDLIISEISIPELNGYDVLTTLRQNPVTAMIPLIFVTTKASRADIRKGMELGADDYLIKPCTLEELLRAITTRLEKQALLWQRLVAHAQRRVSEPPPTNIASIAALQSIFQSVPLLRKVFDFIEVNYHRPITLNDVAQAVGYSPAYLTDLVRQHTGQSLYRWIIHRRMVQAYFLLLDTDQKVDEIATSLGYQNVASFCRQFRQNTGKSPNAWRSELRHCFSSTLTTSKESLIQSKD
ncbi:MAG: response regulator transcription factor [Scytonema sp. RU_4_4]|nr:response regulator transcription factor [Scytonema sp. RU_4_4]NJR73609.1 response regulator transcription factor [Scytonema sp. CRU_2_7]